LRKLIEEELSDGDRPQQIGLEHLAGERSEQHHARVVYEDVGTACLLLDPLGSCSDRAPVGDVGPDRQGVVPKLLG